MRGTLAEIRSLLSSYGCCLSCVLSLLLSCVVPLNGEAQSSPSSQSDVVHSSKPTQATSSKFNLERFGFSSGRPKGMGDRLLDSARAGSDYVVSFSRSAVDDAWSYLGQHSPDELYRSTGEKVRNWTSSQYDEYFAKSAFPSGVRGLHRREIEKFREAILKESNHYRATISSSPYLSGTGKEKSEGEGGFTFSNPLSSGHSNSGGGEGGKR